MQFRVVVEKYLHGSVISHSLLRLLTSITNKIMSTICSFTTFVGSFVGNIIIMLLIDAVLCLNRIV